MGLDQTEKRSSKTNSTGCSIPPLIKSRRHRATGLIFLELFPVLQEQCRRLDSNQRSSESESDALSSYATPTNHPNGLAYSNASLKQSQSPPPFVTPPLITLALRFSSLALCSETFVAPESLSSRSWVAFVFYPRLLCFHRIPVPGPVLDLALRLLGSCLFAFLPRAP